MSETEPLEELYGDEARVAEQALPVPHLGMVYLIWRSMDRKRLKA